MAFYGIIKIVIMSLHLCKNSKTQRTGVVNSPSVALFPMCRPVACGRRRKDKAPNIYIVALRIPYLAKENVEMCYQSNLYRN